MRKHSHKQGDRNEKLLIAMSLNSLNTFQYKCQESHIDISSISLKSINNLIGLSYKAKTVETTEFHKNSYHIT